MGADHDQGGPAVARAGARTRRAGRGWPVAGVEGDGAGGGRQEGAALELGVDVEELGGVGVHQGDGAAVCDPG